MTDTFLQCEDGEIIFVPDGYLGEFCFCSTLNIFDYFCSVNSSVEVPIDGTAYTFKTKWLSTPYGKNRILHTKEFHIRGGVLTYGLQIPRKFRSLILESFYERNPDIVQRIRTKINYIKSNSNESMMLKFAKEFPPASISSKTSRIVYFNGEHLSEHITGRANSSAHEQEKTFPISGHVEKG